MPKLFVVFSARRLAALAAMLVVAAGVFLARGGGLASWATSSLSAIRTLLEPSDFAAERQELNFWQAALTRLDAELQRGTDGPGLASLRAERNSVVERMREIAKRIPESRIPASIRPLLVGKSPAVASAPVAAPHPAISAAPVVAVAAVHVAPLKVGLGPPAPESDAADLVFSPPVPFPVFIEIERHHERHPHPHASPRPANADGAKR